MWSALKGASDAALKFSEQAQASLVSNLDALKPPAGEAGDKSDDVDEAHGQAEAGGETGPSRSEVAAGAAKAKDAMRSFFDRAKEVAKDMKDNAKLTAFEMEEQVKAMASKAQAAASSVAAASQQLPRAGVKPEEDGDSDNYGVTEEFALFVKTLRPKDFQTRARSWPARSAEDAQWSLTPWQEKHVIKVLSVVGELRDCRYFLTPRKMSEQRFWEIYFAISQTYLFSSEQPSPKDDSAGPPGASSAISATDDSSRAGEETDEDDVDDATGGANMDEDLEAYLESVLGAKSQGSGAEGSEGEAGDEDDDEVKSLDAFINELELEDDHSGNDSSSDIVKVEKETE